MQTLHLIFSPSGRLARGLSSLPPLLFIWPALPPTCSPGRVVVLRAGLWPFLFVQALLIWIWFAVHAKRLHDAGRSAGFAAGVAILYALSIALLVIVAASFYGALAGQMPFEDANTASALGLILLLSIIAFLLGAPHYDLAWLMVAILLSIAFVPVVLAFVVTLWAATRPSVQERAG